MRKWTEDTLKEWIIQKTAKWECSIQKMDQNWRLLFAYPMFIIVFMVGSCFNDYMPFFLTVTAVFVYIFVKNILRCVITKRKIRVRIVTGAIILLLYVAYCWNFWS